MYSSGNGQLIAVRRKRLNILCVAILPDLQLTALIATEEYSDNDTRIEWKLLTDLPVANLAEATEKLEWYSHRWKIETFHKVMKSGCQAERS